MDTDQILDKLQDDQDAMVAANEAAQTMYLKTRELLTNTPGIDLNIDEADRFAFQVAGDAHHQGMLIAARVLLAQAQRRAAQRKQEKNLKFYERWRWLFR